MGVFDALDDLKKPEQSAKNENISKGNQIDVSPRYEMSANDVTNAWQLAKSQMNEILSKDVEEYLNDILHSDENRIYSVRSSPKGRRSQLVLTNKALYIFSYGIFSGEGQNVDTGMLGLDLLMARARMAIRIYPLDKIQNLEIQPLKGITVGHLQVFTSSSLGNEETKFIIDTNLGYFKAVLVYKKVSELLSCSRSSQKP
jgi:hypothetical protein